MAGISAVYAHDEALPPIQVQCSLMSLPFAFATAPDTIPTATPYITARPDRIAAWAETLGPWSRMRIGLAWSGSASHAADRSRSIPLAAFDALIGGSDAEWHVVQRDIRPTDQAALDEIGELADHSDSLTDFAETAALISHLDLVISVDTAVAHLAGAMGKPVWILLSAAPDWRWMHHRLDSPWYPTARLFRQAKLNDWSSVLADISNQLTQWSVRRA